MLSIVPHVGEMFKNSAARQSMEMNVNRSLGGNPAVQLSPAEVTANMKGAVDSSPIIRGLLLNKGYASTIPALTGMGLLPKPER